MVKDMDSSIVFCETEVVDQIVRPNDLHPCYTAQISCCEILLELHPTVCQSWGFTEVTLQMLAKASLNPRYFSLTREAKGQTPTVDHEKDTRGQIHRVVQKLILFRVGGRQFLTNAMLDLPPECVRLDLSSDLDDITQCSQGDVTASVSQCVNAFLMKVLPVRPSGQFLELLLGREPWGPP